MENITLGQVATALAFLVSLIGSLEFIFIRLKRFISKEIKPLKIESIKVDLVNLMCFAEQGIISEEQKKLAYELFDEYTNAGQNSYVHSKWENLRKEGKI